GIWHERGADAQALLPLAAYAWYSHAEGTTARGLIERPWTAETSFAKAVEAARSWFVRCLSDYCNDDQGVTGRWFVAQRCSGFRIVPLRAPDELTREGNRMRHCVGDYAGQVVTGACLIYSIRRGNAHVATVEIRPHWERKGQPAVAQLRGPDNEDVGEDITHAVTQWLSRQGRYPFAGSGQLARMPFNEQRWAKLWAPFQDAKDDRKLAIQPLQVHRALEKLSRYA
ncbi:MAG: PcfJ domain-containing protein, partial [Hyphomicrobiaceae bacterium]